MVLALSLVRDGISCPPTPGMGILGGLGGLSKLAGSALLPMSLLAISIASWKESLFEQRGHWWLLRQTCFVGRPVIVPDCF